MTMTEITIDGITLTPLMAAIYGDIAIIADMHIGYEAWGPLGMAPLTLDTMKNSLREIKHRYMPEILVVAGDFKHSFSKARGMEWRSVRDGLEFLAKSFPEVHIIRGNHDNYLINVIKRLMHEGYENIFWHEDFIDGDLRIFHGHKNYYINGKWNIMGHEHPAVEVGDSLAKRKYPASIVDTQRKIIVLPAFSPIMYGVVARKIIDGDGLSSLWHTPSRADIYMIDGKDIIKTR